MSLLKIVAPVEQWAAKNKAAAEGFNIRLDCKCMPDGSKAGIEFHADYALGLIEVWSIGSVDFHIMADGNKDVVVEYLSFEDEAALTGIFDLCFERVRGLQK